jgi:hypothetical protein
MAKSHRETKVRASQYKWNKKKQGKKQENNNNIYYKQRGQGDGV